MSSVMKAAPVVPSRRPTYCVLSPLWGTRTVLPSPHPDADCRRDPTFDAVAGMMDRHPRKAPRCPTAPSP